MGKESVMSDPNPIMTQVATEALKPVSGIIDALIGPRVARLKSWSQKKDLASRANSQAINNLFDRYLRQLIRKISSITTIIFPQKPIYITQIYEPLTLVEGIIDFESEITYLKRILT